MKFNLTNSNGRHFPDGARVHEIEISTLEELIAFCSSEKQKSIQNAGFQGIIINDGKLEIYDDYRE